VKCILHKGRFLYADILRNEITFEQNIWKTSVLAAKDESTRQTQLCQMEKLSLQFLTQQSATHLHFFYNKCLSDSDRLNSAFAAMFNLTRHSGQAWIYH